MDVGKRLEELKEIEGFFCAGLISKEGELIVATKGDTVEMEMVGALVNNLVMNAQSTAEELGLGGSNSIDLTTLEGSNIFIRYYSGEKVSFSLIMICAQETRLGIIHYHLNQIMPKLVEELIYTIAPPKNADINTKEDE